jgi:hypothetical protein
MSPSQQFGWLGPVALLAALELWAIRADRSRARREADARLADALRASGEVQTNVIRHLVERDRAAALDGLRHAAQATASDIRARLVAIPVNIVGLPAGWKVVTDKVEIVAGMFPTVQNIVSQFRALTPDSDEPIFKMVAAPPRDIQEVEQLVTWLEHLAEAPAAEAGL